MANPEHVEIVKQGAKAIAAWRAENLAEEIELLEAATGGMILTARLAWVEDSP